MQAIQPRRPPQRPFTVRLPQAQVEELDRLARNSGCLRSDVVRQALRVGLYVLADDDQKRMP